MKLMIKWIPRKKIISPAGFAVVSCSMVKPARQFFNSGVFWAKKILFFRQFAVML